MRSRRNGRPTLAEAGGIRDAILAAAECEFASKGFHAASIDSISRRCDISRLTIYRHFTNKPGLFQAVVSRHGGVLRTKLEALDAETREPSAVLLEVANSIYDVTLVPEIREIMRLGIAERPRLPEFAQMLYESGRETMAPLIRYLERMDREGRLAVPDPTASALLFCELCNGGVAYLMVDRTRTPEGKQRWIETVVDLFLNGCRPRP